MNNSNWIAFRIPKPQAKLRLFCFPHAGGGASFFRLWSEELPAEVEICPVQLPGRENRVMDPPIDNLELLLKSLTLALFPYLDMPFAFFGHSLGALISFEFARYLRREHKIQPFHLFVSSYQAPPLENKLPPISHLPDVEFINQLRKLNSTPEEVFEHEELVELLLPSLRADFAIYEKYKYHDEEPLDCPISAFGGQKDTLIFEEDLLAWQRHTRKTFVLRLFPGDHFYLYNSDRTSLLHAIAQNLQQSPGLPR